MATIPEALAIAVRHHQAGRWQAAEEIYRQVLALHPDHPDALHLLGVLFHQAGRHEEAIESIAAAIRHVPTEAAYHHNLGEAHRALARTDEAVACYRRAVALDPACAEAHYHWGVTLKTLGRRDEAIDCYRRALDVRPGYVEAHAGLGIALKQQGRTDEAIACYRRALELQPDRLDTLNNLGNALRDQGSLDEAIACYHRAIERRADYAEAHYNLAIALRDQGKLDLAVACVDRALELKPEFADAHVFRAQVRLLTGDWARGWPEYEWRWLARDLAGTPLRRPFWDGGPLEGKTILLSAEQGLGDTIQLVRYAAIVKRRGGTVVVQCAPALMKLLASCPGIDRLVAEGDALPPWDVHAPLGSLPGILGTSPVSVPAEIPYLDAEPALVQHWRERLRGPPGRKIGIHWQGSPLYRGDRLRSFPLSCFEPLARREGVRLVSLQKGPGSEQIRETENRFPVAELGNFDEASGPFLDTAAVMKNLDLVITSDTATAHLAGALGVPVWVAVPYLPDWRWLLDRRDCPWYPSMRLFRQSRLGDWPGVFAEIGAALAERIGSTAAD